MTFGDFMGNFREGSFLLDRFIDELKVDEYFFALKENKTTVGWETDFWYLTKLRDQVYMNDGNYIFPSKLIYFFEQRKERLNQANPDFVLDKKIILKSNDIINLHVNNSAYNLKQENNFGEISKMSLYSGKEVERKMNNMAYGSYFQFISELL